MLRSDWLCIQVTLYIMNRLANKIFVICSHTRLLSHHCYHTIVVTRFTPLSLLFVIMDGCSNQGVGGLCCWSWLKGAWPRGSAGGDEETKEEEGRRRNCAICWCCCKVTRHAIDPALRVQVHEELMEELTSEKLCTQMGTIMLACLTQI